MLLPVTFSTRIYKFSGTPIIIMFFMPIIPIVIFTFTLPLLPFLRPIFFLKRPYCQEVKADEDYY